MCQRGPLGTKPKSQTTPTAQAQVVQEVVRTPWKWRTWFLSNVRRRSPRRRTPWRQSTWWQSTKSLPSFKLSSNYRACSILEVRQPLEDWLSKSTLTIATWRGDAQRYRLEQVLEIARVRRDQWLRSTPDQRASLEPAYILGDRKLIPEAVNAVESVLRTELLDAMPKSLADSCIRHGHCAADLIIWYIVKQLPQTQMRSQCRRKL